MMTRFHRRVATALALTFVAATALAPKSLAADITDIGFVDQAALASLPAFQAANRQLAQYKAGLDAQFARQMKGMRSPSDQQRLAQSFQVKLQTRQRELLGPLFLRAQTAIASVASSKNLSVIVDKHIVIFGGQDVTRGVVDLVGGVGDPVPPVTSPPPSTVGYVDQQAVDAVPKLKSANDDFTKFQDDQRTQAQAKLKAAKTDDDRRKILTDLQKTIGDHKTAVIDPLVDQTRGVIGDIAKKHNLLLVIDRSNLVYGGTDITADVTAALK